MPKKRRRGKKRNTGNRGPQSSTSSSTHSGTTDVTTPPTMKGVIASVPPERAKLEKEKGGEEYKKQKFQLAIGHFTKSIALFGGKNPSPSFLVNLFTHRASAHLRLKEYTQAIEDSDVALKLDPSYWRAYICRSLARFYIGNVEAALSDCKQALKISKEIHTQNESLQLNLEILLGKMFGYITHKNETKKKKKKDKSSIIGPTEWIGDTSALQPPLSMRVLIDDFIINDCKMEYGDTMGESNLEETNNTTKSLTNNNIVTSSMEKVESNEMKVVELEKRVPSSDKKVKHKLMPCPALLVPIGEALDARTNLFASDPMLAEKQSFMEKELGNEAFVDANYMKALVHYSRCIKLNSKEPVFYSNRALVYIRLERYYECVSDCTASIDRKPSIKAYARRGTAWAQLNEHLLAAANFQEALRFEPHNQTCLEDLYRSLNRLECEYQQKLSQNPNNEKIRNDLRIVQEDIRRTTLVLGTKENAGKKMETPTKPVMSAAISHFTSILATDPTDSDAYLGRAEAYEEQGDIPRAIADLQRALKLDPDNKDVQQKYRQLLEASRKHV